MFEFDVNTSVVIEQQQILEAALSTNPKAQTLLRKLIRKYIAEARKLVVSNIKFEGGDPRRSAQAVRTTVYRLILGGNLNIYNSRKAHGSNNYHPPRHPSKIGGNRRTISERTQKMMGYPPLDRGMILRWQNDGTNVRNIEFNADDKRKVDRWNKHPNTGNRSSLTAQNFFRRLGDSALGTIRDNLATAIEEEMTNMMNSKQ